MDAGCEKFEFSCADCPIVEEFEYRRRIYEEHPELGDFQYDHCACEKVGGEFFMCGYCNDAWKNVEKNEAKGIRKGGSAYRREMKRKKFKRKKAIYDNGSYAFALGYDKAGMEHCCGWYPIDSEPAYHYTYIKPPKSSKSKTFWKKHSSRVLRRKKLDLPTQKGNHHRKVFDYWWEVF